MYAAIALAAASAFSASASEDIAFLLRTRLEQPAAEIAIGDERIHATSALPAFYEERLYRPAWTGEPLRVLALDLLRALRESALEGLRPEDYHLAKIEQLLDRSREQPAEPAVLADLDLLLTDAFLIYGAHLISGRVHPESFDPEWVAVRREVDLLPVLKQALEMRRPRETLRSLLPAHPGYGRLRDALARYRKLAEWPPVAGESRFDSVGPDVLALRRRLAASGDLQPDDPGGELFDAALEEAVKRYQTRNGLGADGVVGAKTLKALAVSVAERARQIELNLERWRWLPQDLGRNYVLVNIPDFTLRVVDDGAEVHAMRAVVGRSYRRTPVMSDTIKYLVINPYWEVPHKLAVEDKLPEIRKDPGYLAHQKFHVYQGWGSDEREIDPASVDWQQVDRRNFPYRLRQDPGPLNALGRFKFMFPNKFSVYIHDTPSRELFRRSERAASSGCIRVEAAVDLAEYLLRADPGWSRESIVKAVERMETKTIPLPEPVAVHIEYWTAWVDDAGVTHFREDIYQRDAQLAAALALPPPEGNRDAEAGAPASSS